MVGTKNERFESCMFNEWSVQWVICSIDDLFNDWYVWWMICSMRDMLDESSAKLVICSISDQFDEWSVQWVICLIIVSFNDWYFWWVICLMYYGPILLFVTCPDTKFTPDRLASTGRQVRSFWNEFSTALWHFSLYNQSIHV